VRAAAALLSACLLARAVAAAPAADPGQCTPPAAPEATSEAGAALERGNALAARGESAAALAAFVESRALARAAGAPALELLAAASAARVRVGSAPSEAEREIEALLAATAALEDPATRARLRIHAARSLEELGRRRRAAELLLAASEDAAAAPDERLRSYALGYLGGLYEQVGRAEDALELTRRALVAARRADAPDAAYRWEWQLARLLLARRDADGAITAYRSAVATLRGAREISDPDLADLYLGFVDLLLQRAAAGDPAATQALLAEARSALEDQGAGELRDYFRDACLDAQRKAAPDEVPGALVVYPILLRDRTVLVTSRSRVLASHVVPVGREALTAEVRSLRELLEKRTTRQYLRPARQLYEWLIRPLEADLAAEGVDTLVFVPSGPLRTIPLAALHDAQQDRYLIEKIPIAITPGLTLTEPRPIERAGLRVLAAGLSEPVQGYPGLENVTRELEAVSEVFPARRLENAEFRTQRFESEVEGQAFDIVHVASHGEFAADASRSYLLTWDGRIPMDRLGELVGTTRFGERGLELLALSACETAAGDDRAALGLAGVALRAGARSALATMWAVDDRAAAELVSEFYAGLGDAKLSRAAALQRAQLKVLRTPSYRHPGYWAPYVLISNWL
jgi:CHAT domain-containing protein